MNSAGSIIIYSKLLKALPVIVFEFLNSNKLAFMPMQLE